MTAIAAATVASTVAACGGSDDSGGGTSSGGGGGENEASDIGVTEDSIKLGAHYPLTGVAAPGYSEIPTGVQAYFDCLNQEGGIYGRDVEFIFRDDAYNPTQTSQVTNELVLEDEIFAMMSGLGTPTHSAVVDFLNDEGVPDLFVSSGSLLWGEDPEQYPMSFGWQTDYESEGKIIGEYIANEFPDAKVGLLPPYAAGKPPVAVPGLTPFKLSSNEKLHGAVAADRPAARLRPAVVLLQRGFGPDAGRRPAQPLQRGRRQ